MITVQDAFSWLNWEEGVSHLGNSSHFSVWQIYDSKVSDAERNAIMEALIHCLHDFTDPLEKAEVYANLGIDRYNRKFPDQARHYLIEARKIYEEQKDRHRQAVIEWILFIVLYNMLENIQAHSHARASRTIFFDQAAQYKPLGEPGAAKALWYHARITDMTRDLDGVPEEAYEWLSQFEPSAMSASTIQIRESVRKLIMEKNFTGAYQRIATLQKVTQRCPDVLETAESLAFCGLSIYQMGNAQDAIHYLRSALACAVHSNHEHASIRWMLGLILYRIPAEQCNGINHMEASLRGFEGLSQLADRQNKPKAVEWYETQHEAMGSVLKQMICGAA